MPRRIPLAAPLGWPLPHAPQSRASGRPSSRSLASNSGSHRPSQRASVEKSRPATEDWARPGGAIAGRQALLPKDSPVTHSLPWDRRELQAPPTPQARLPPDQSARAQSAGHAPAGGGAPSLFPLRAKMKAAPPLRKTSNKPGRGGHFCTCESPTLSTLASSHVGGASFHSRTDFFFPLKDFSLNLKSLSADGIVPWK